MNKNLKKLIIGALFAAFTCAATFISVPLPIGYANLGDILVLLSAFTLGPDYGALAAGIGAGLADFLVGYAMYVPGTFVIKALMALVAVSLFRALSSKINLPIVCYAVSAVVGELIMVGGYYLYESLILGYGFAGAAAPVFGNCMQGVVGAVVAVLLVIPVSKLMKKAKI